MVQPTPTWAGPLHRLWSPTPHLATWIHAVCRRRTGAVGGAVGTAWAVPSGCLDAQSDVDWACVSVLDYFTAGSRGFRRTTITVCASQRSPRSPIHLLQVCGRCTSKAGVLGRSRARESRTSFSYFRGIFRDASSATIHSHFRSLTRSTSAASHRCAHACCACCYPAAATTAGTRPQPQQPWRPRRPRSCSGRPAEGWCRTRWTA